MKLARCVRGPASEWLRLGLGLLLVLAAAAMASQAPPPAGDVRDRDFPDYFNSMEPDGPYPGVAWLHGEPPSDYTLNRMPVWVRRFAPHVNPIMLALLRLALFLLGAEEAARACHALRSGSERPRNALLGARATWLLALTLGGCGLLPDMLRLAGPLVNLLLMAITAPMEALSTVPVAGWLLGIAWALFVPVLAIGALGLLLAQMPLLWRLTGFLPPYGASLEKQVSCVTISWRSQGA